ncbi:hypothetical protein GWG54_09240 [Natronococcus sp. JC468]|uniref:hypothetical protein n=1 Tax=Natronococcus sp. JC468 TaxID=1961921 RepID=UPI00143979A3|nr:hypothetical protein [Natronococcus sp. JC468]NKE36001.1 hypothetical protein [Natronococcus sp. JC468]
MTSEHDRRRFLQLTGTSAAATVAGCTDVNPLNDGGDGGEHGDVLTAVVGPSTAEIEELRERVAEEELDMTEAQQRQQELVEDAIEAFETRAEDDDGLSIEDASPEYGLYRVDGDAGTIVDELNGGSIASLSEGAAYDRILAERERRSEGGNVDPDGEIDANESDPDGERNDESDDGGQGANGTESDDGPTDASSGEEVA